MGDAFFSDIDVDVNYFENTSLGYQYSAIGNYFNCDQFNEDFRECTVNTDNNLSVLHLNIRSIAANGDELVGYLETLNITGFDLPLWNLVE